MVLVFVSLVGPEHHYETVLRPLKHYRLLALLQPFRLGFITTNDKEAMHVKSHQKFTCWKRYLRCE